MAEWFRVQDLKSDLEIEKSVFFQSTQLESKMYNVEVVTKGTYVYFILPTQSLSAKRKAWLKRSSASK